MSAGSQSHPVRPTLLTPLRGQPDLQFYLLARSCSQFATHMFNVAIGWQVYELTGDVFSLGVVGIVRFAPAILLFPLAGYVADRFRRLMVYCIATMVQFAACVVFLLNALTPESSMAVIYLTLLIFGSGRAFANTAARSILASVTVRKYLPNAIAIHSVVARTAALLGPVIGGIVIGLAGGYVYGAVSATFAIGLLALSRIGRLEAADAKQPFSFGNLLGGLAYARSNRIILCVISLDLLSVIGGTVIGILPVFAKDVLGVGPEGLGLLRSMPALGAILVALLIGQIMPRRATGWLLFGSLVAHGFMIVVFGLSTSFWLSLFALALYGGTDMVGVWIRQTTIQLATPNTMLGRVNAVDIASSNGSEELGNFRSGVMAAAVGAPFAVVLGGITTILIAAIWCLNFPELRRIRRIDEMNQPD